MVEEEKQEFPKEIDLDSEKIRKEILQLPLIIRSLRTTLIKQDSEVIELINKRKVCEARITEEVLTTKTQNEGKNEKKFTNKQSRDAEIKKRVDIDEEMNNIRKEEKKARREVEITKADIEYCSNRLIAVNKLIKFFYPTNK